MLDQAGSRLCRRCPARAKSKLEVRNKIVRAESIARRGGRRCVLLNWGLGLYLQAGEGWTLPYRSALLARRGGTSVRAVSGFPIVKKSRIERSPRLGPRRNFLQLHVTGHVGHGMEMPGLPSRAGGATDLPLRALARSTQDFACKAQNCLLALHCLLKQWL